MSKNRDLISILALVIIAMFIPFLGSMMITYGLDMTNVNDWYKIGSTFGYFLLIFGIELISVMLYFKITNKVANKKLKEYNKK